MKLVGFYYKAKPELSGCAHHAPNEKGNSKLKGHAFFVKHPSRIDELIRPHLPDDRKPFTIVKAVKLTRLDYENFTTDMSVERPFLEGNADRCCTQPDGSLPCLFVHQRGQKDGILALPDQDGFVIWAAYWSGVCDMRNPRLGSQHTLLS